MLKKIFALVLFLVLIGFIYPVFNSTLSYTNNYSIISLLDTIKPVITHTPINNIPKALWPVSVNAFVSDSSGIDSVWVKWYKNNPANGKRFRLNYISGTSYQGLFNSINAEVNNLDSIFYRIFAQDNSANHNKDSTALYKFKIIPMYPGCSGWETIASNYPFATYWMDARTQILLTESELTALGFYTNMPIMIMGFYVQSYSPQVMNGLCISFQNTSLTSLTGFVNSGWTISYLGNYSIYGTGYQSIAMNNYSFHWNGTSNLLIEFCFHNTSYTSNTTVNSSPAAGKTWANSVDLSPGCFLPGGSSQVNRPNLCFIIPDKINQYSSEIPSHYTLCQNYPNPFNSETRIDFKIPKNGIVNLKIFDILGREVKTLVKEDKPAGSYSVDFNASDLSSGLYFYKIESGAFTDIKKMILIK